MLYRAIVVFYDKFQTLLPVKYSVDDLLAILDLGSDKELFSRWEYCFSQMIYKDGIYELQKKYVVPVPGFDKWSLHMPHVFVSSLFYSLDREFTADRSINAEMKRDGKTQVTFRFS